MKPIPEVSAPLSIAHFPATRRGSETPVRYPETTSLPGHQPGSPASLAAWLGDVLQRVHEGDTLILPPGTFGLTAPMELPANVKLIGAGMGLTTLTFTQQSKGITAYLRCSGDCALMNLSLTVIPDTKSRPTHLADNHGEPYPNPAHYDAAAELTTSALIQHHAEDDEPATLRLSGVELRTGGYSLAPVGTGSHKWLIAATFDGSARGIKPGATIITPSSFTTKGSTNAKAKRRTSTRSRTRTTRAAAG